MNCGLTRLESASARLAGSGRSCSLQQLQDPLASPDAVSSRDHLIQSTLRTSLQLRLVRVLNFANQDPAGVAASCSSVSDQRSSNRAARLSDVLTGEPPALDLRLLIQPARVVAGSATRSMLCTFVIASTTVSSPLRDVRASTL